jgi:hypothetical protein
MLTMRRERINGFSNGMTGAALTGMRTVLAAVAGLVLLLSALLLGAVLGFTLLAWKLLSGRRARVMHFGRRGAGTKSRPRPRQSDVIDVEAREVAPRETHTF